MGKFFSDLSSELSLHVRQLAWLTAKPAPDKPSLNGPEPLSRMEKIRAEGGEAPLPDVSAPWVIDKLMEIGPVVPAGMGPGPITWRDIAAWQEVTAFPLAPWEARMIRNLSAEYLSMLTEARKPECPAPWTPLRLEEVDRAAVGVRVGNAFRAIAAAQRQT